MRMMTRDEVIQQLSFWKELWESKKAECDKYENREYAWEKKYMLNCNIEVCKIALESLKQPEQKKGYWIGRPIAGCATVRCSVCTELFWKNRGRWNFCPNCGAEMEEEE